jgi:hypothetical protein
MTKVKFLVSMLVVAMLLLPTVALAQEGSDDMAGPPTCGFYGTVILNGQSVEDGTTVTASVDGAPVASTVTGEYIIATQTQLADDEYVINVPGNYVGKSIEFTVEDGDNTGLAQTAAWTAGGYSKLDLVAYEVAIGNAQIVLKPTAGVATNACGTGFTPYRTVMISFAGEVVAKATADSNGAFCAGVIPTMTEVDEYTIEADDGFRSADATFSLTGVQGEKGDKGDTGEQGEQGLTGQKGDKGDDAAGSSSALAIVALIIAVIAVILAVVFGIRGKQQPAA